MQIPDKVKIGWREYLIQKYGARRNTNGDLLCGEIDYVKHTIYLNNEYSEEQMKVTLLHEIMHGIFNREGHTDWRENEDLIDAIAEGLFELLKDNPELFKEV